MKRAKRFFINAIILGCTTVLLRAISLGFNVYITNKIGAEGVGLFGLIMSVYMLATTIASSGASLAATRLVTEELSLGYGLGMKKTMNACMCYTLFFGVSAAVLLFLFAKPIGQIWLGDSRTIRPLYLLSISLPFIALSAAINGYFVAVRRIVKSASAQIFEIFIKIAITIFALPLLIHRGIEYACIAIVGGGSMAEIASFIYLYVLYALERRNVVNNREGEGRYICRLLGVALPIAVSSYLRSGLVTLEHLLVPIGLKKFGASASASLAQYGVVHGMVMPLLLFPSAILGAFAGLLVPELTEFQKTGHETGIEKVVVRALRTTLMFSIGAAGIFYFFAYDLGQSIYHSDDAGLFIKFLSPLIVVMYTDGVVDAMLKGLNKQVNSMRFNIIDSIVSVIMIYVLLPRFGVNGYIAVIFVTELLNAFLSLNCLIKTTDFKLSLRKNILVPLLAVLVSISGVHLVRPSILGGLRGKWQVFFAIFLAAVLYVILLSVWGYFKKD